MPQSVHDTLPPLATQLPALLGQGWEQEVLSRLPQDYHQHARRTGAFVRSRKLRSAGDLLRGLMAYVLLPCSLRLLGAWAVLIGLGNLSQVAWHQRLVRARAWLLWLLMELLAVNAAPWPRPERRVILIDATRLKEPGGCGDDWRVHLGYDLVAGRLWDVRVSDRHTGERLTLFALRPGDLVVADRGYCRRGSVAFALSCGAAVVMRLAVGQFPLLDLGGQPFDVLAWLRAGGSGTHACAVAFEHGGRRFALRLLACSLPPDSTARAQQAARRKASKQQHQIQEQTLFLCGWVLLLSSLAQSEWTDQQVLTLYRARWQIEVVIKRMKQVLRLAQVRGQTAATNEATILAVLVAWALLEPEVSQARQALGEAIASWQQAHQQAATAQAPDPVSPQAQACLSSWTLLALLAQTLRQQVLGHWTFERLHACWPFLLRYLAHRSLRGHQESTIRRHLLARMALVPTTSSSLFFCSSA